MYLEVSLTSCALLTQKLTQAVKRREKQQVELAAIPEERQDRSTPPRDRAGSAETAASKSDVLTVDYRGLKYYQVHVFGRPIVVRLLRLDYRVPHKIYPRVTFETEYGVIDKCECPEEVVKFGEQDVGKLFKIELQFIHERERNGDEVSAFYEDFKIDEIPDSFSTFRGVVLILYRPAAQQILLLREHEISPAAAAVRLRLMDGVLCDHLATEDRFAGASKKQQKERYTLKEVMVDVNMADMFDVEVDLLSRLDTPEGYTGFLRHRSMAPVPADDPKFVRSLDIDTCEQLRKLFEQEKANRDGCVPKIANQYGLFERAGSATAFIGTAESQRFFVGRDALLQLYWKELFSEFAQVETTTAAAVPECIEDGRKLAIEVVEVPEEVLKMSELEDGGFVMLPSGLKTQAYRCKWFNVKDPTVQGISDKMAQQIQELITSGAPKKLVINKSKNYKR
eukprot:TRINITY_DN34445_c0_g1_i1.p1 TRINITY_DN34445_c0_g1~~TRINITY_DN34445_c0_g1_i1.p1  ORF type:complete len:452 (-),score=80.68 TRINITY_DN34445_c0_g1_i1:55-1410(-)